MALSLPGPGGQWEGRGRKCRHCSGLCSCRAFEPRLHERTCSMHHKEPLLELPGKEISAGVCGWVQSVSWTSSICAHWWIQRVSWASAICAHWWIQSVSCIHPSVLTGGSRVSSVFIHLCSLVGPECQLGLSHLCSLVGPEGQLDLSHLCSLVDPECQLYSSICAHWWVQSVSWASAICAHSWIQSVSWVSSNCTHYF